MIFLVSYFFDILILLMPSQPGGDDGGDDGDGGERISKSDPAPFPSRPGMEYRVRLPLTPTIGQPQGLSESGFLSEWGEAECDIPSLGVMGMGVDQIWKFFCRRRRRRRRRRRPPKGVFYWIPNPLFFDTCKRSRRETAAKRLVRSLRFFFIFIK